MTKKNLIALLLALAMCLSLAACGSGSDNSGSKSDSASATATPEYVYAAEYTDLMTDVKNYISVQAFTDDGFYATCYEKVGENIPEGVTPEYEGQYDVYENVLYYVSNDGTMSKLENYTAIEGAENTNGYKDYSTSSGLSGFKIADDGKLITIEYTYTSWYDGPDGITQYSDEYWQYQQYEQKYYIRSLDTDGTELTCAEITVDENDYIQAYYMQVDENDNVVVPTSSSIRAIKLDGTDAYNISVDGYYIDTIIKLADGRLAAAYWGESEETLAVIDTATGTLGEGVEVDSNIYNAIRGAGDYDMYYTSGTNFYGYKIEDGTSEKLFSWLDCDVNGDNIGANTVSVSEDGTITALISEYDEKAESYSYQQVTVQKVPSSSVPQKQIITLAGIGYDYNVIDKIIEFNRSSDEYRIEMTDYSEYNTDEDSEAGLTKLNTEIMAGNVPDILYLNGLNYTQLASKGLLEDLYPYIDSDSELSRDDFFQNVLAAMEVDGKLCTTVANFSVQSVVGAASVVGDEPGWTYDELNAALASMPEGCTVFDQYTTRDDILQTCLALDMDSFVNWGTGECNFDSEQFVQLLEFAKSFPSDFDWDNYEWSEEESTENRIMQGKQMLAASYIYSVEDLMYNNYEQWFNGDYTFIGFPTTSGTGSMFTLSGGNYAMSATSEYKDAIWQFLREFFTEDYQDEQYSLPSNRKVFEAKLEEACTVEYQKDNDGNYLLDENGEKIPIEKYGIYNSETGEYEYVYAMSEELAAKVTALVENTTKLANYDDSIYSIVSEQAAAYFADQKSAEEVAKLVQSKANIFVNEQM